jgi:hypothetical protein
VQFYPVIGFESLTRDLKLPERTYCYIREHDTCTVHVVGLSRFHPLPVGAEDVREWKPDEDTCVSEQDILWSVLIP